MSHPMIHGNGILNATLLSRGKFQSLREGSFLYSKICGKVGDSSESMSNVPYNGVIASFAPYISRAILSLLSGADTRARRQPYERAQRLSRLRRQTREKGDCDWFWVKLTSVIVKTYASIHYSVRVFKVILHIVRYAESKLAYSGESGWLCV